jgi:hypothetical protein
VIDFRISLLIKAHATQLISSTRAMKGDKYVAPAFAVEDKLAGKRRPAYNWYAML